MWCLNLLYKFRSLYHSPNAVHNLITLTLMEIKHGSFLKGQRISFGWTDYYEVLLIQSKDLSTAGQQITAFIIENNFHIPTSHFIENSNHLLFDLFSEERKNTGLVCEIEVNTGYIGTLTVILMFHSCYATIQKNPTTLKTNIYHYRKKRRI